MYFHPLMLATAKRYYGARGDAAAQRSARPTRDGRSRELCTVILAMKCLVSEERRQMLAFTAHSSRLADVAVLFVSLLARAGEEAQGAVVDRFSVETERIRKRAEPMRTQYATETAYVPDTSSLSRKARVQRWSVDPRVG